MCFAKNKNKCMLITNGNKKLRFPNHQTYFFLEQFSTETMLQTKSPYIRNFCKQVTVDDYLAREGWINRSDLIDLNRFI